jgi:hypothetical protein
MESSGLTIFSDAIRLPRDFMTKQIPVPVHLDQSICFKQFEHNFLTKLNKKKIGLRYVTRQNTLDLLETTQQLGSSRR